jgi:hypothetical protein
MKKHKPKPVKKRSSSRRLVIAAAIVAVIVAAGVIAVASRRRAADADSTPSKTKSNISTVEKKYLSVNVAGREVQVDPQTGQIKPMSAEQAKEIADLMKARLNKSTDGLVQVRNADGSVSMDLQGRAQNVVLARTNDDGTVEEACVDEPLAGARFLGIDPKLVGVETPKSANGQAISRTAARKAVQ